MENYEKLGTFYLGRTYDLNKSETSNELLLYDSKDLTTHAVCVGMTGSGKTGLCVSMLEEAAIDGIPAIIIDPKGDMTNLLLNFPNLSPEEFAPWVNESDARKKNLSRDEYAIKQSEFWKKGLESWGQGSDRVKRLKESANFSIYTPGSSAGLPISILKSFAAPPQEVIDDEDTFKERIAATATSLLGLVGIDADPIKSREHILLSTILNHFWSRGNDLDLAALIQSIQSPPVTKIGVFDLETFYPPKERFELAMALNNLLASPSFQTWLEGEALDINLLLYTDSGKPRISIFYIAHLSDAERMFFVSLLLNQVLGWMRTQSGTSSLRAILYFDEIFGYMPPVANPPSKKILLTLLKQARAFGLGIVLATQNPVDLDYKGLSNTGTWFIGRLQTERDRDRVLDGLTSAAGSSGLNRKTAEQMISRLGKRVFLLHNVHEDKPEIFYTRWAMSYLCGPLTRVQIKELVDKSDTGKRKTVTPAKPREKAVSRGREQQPVIGPEIPQLFLPIQSVKPADAKLVYRPFLWGSGEAQLINKTKGVDVQRSIKLITPIEDSAVPVDWANAREIDIAETELLKAAEEAAEYESVPKAARQSKNYKKWESDFKTYLYRSQKLSLLKSQTFDEVSQPGESERDFRIRLAQIARERRDEWIDALRKKYNKKIATLESKIRRAEERLDREQDQSKQQKLQTAISIGTTLLGAFLGRKKISRSTISKAGTAMRSASRTMKEAGDVDRARENVELLQQQLKDLEIEFQDEIDGYTEKFDAKNDELETLEIRLQKSHIQVKLISFLWVPYWAGENDELILA